MSFDSTSGTSSRFKTVAAKSLTNFLFPLTTLITGPLLARARWGQPGVAFWRRYWRLWP
jgi:hypothetical protein